MCGTNVRYKCAAELDPLEPAETALISGKSPSQRRPAGPPPAGKIPNPTPTGRTAAGRKNPQTKSASVVCLLLSVAVCCRRHTGKPALPAISDHALAQCCAPEFEHRRSEFVFIEVFRDPQRGTLVRGLSEHLITSLSRHLYGCFFSFFRTSCSHNLSPHLRVVSSPYVTP